MKSIIENRKIFQSISHSFKFWSFFQNYILMIHTNNCYWSIITTTLIARLICKTIQSIFLFKTLKTLSKRLAIVRKIVDHYQKFLKSRINCQNRNRKSKSKSKIDNRRKFQSVSHSTSFVRRLATQRLHQNEFLGSWSTIIFMRNKG